jgi:cytochrome b involved in lipid metabolism
MSSPNEGVYKYSYQKPFGLVIKSVFRLTRSSVVDKERTVVRKSSKATGTSNTCSDSGGTSKVQTIGTGITKVLLYIGLIGYLMLYKQQNVNYVLFLWNGIMVLTMLVSVVQDLFLEQYYSSTILKWWANTTTPSVPGAPTSTAIADTGTTSSSSTGSPRAVVFNNSRKIPCPLEYNILVQVVTGFILYSIALAVLLLLDDTPSTKDTVTSDGSLAHRFVSLATSKVDTLLSGATKNSSTDWSTNFGHGRVLSDDTAASVTIQFVVGYIKKRIEEGLKQMKFSYHNDSEVLLQVISILASYHLFERTWWALFCFPLDDYVGTREGYFRIVQSNVVFPALLILVLLMKSNLYETLIDSLNTNPTTVHVTMSTVLFGWIIYKLVDFAWSWKTLTSKSIYISQSLEPTVIDTTVHLGQQEQESSTTKSVDDDTNCITTLSSDYEVLRGRNERNNNVANIWNIYGNQYDVTDFVKFHPGGTESIMLAANRDDATALFQSYHPFNIKKAHAVLEKYRINSLTTSATPAADDGGGTGTKDSETILSTTASDYTNLVQYGHYNDIFYDVLCQRVAECLQEKYHMVPIRDRDASYQRLAFYALIIICNGYSLYKYCQVCCSNIL